MKWITRNYWEGALCAETDPELFFPLKGKFLDAQSAIRICNKCELKQKCLEFALKDPELKGIWGGTSEPNRVKMRNRSGRWN